MEYIVDYVFMIIGSIAFIFSKIFNIINLNTGMLIFSSCLFMGFCMGKVKNKMSKSNKVIFILFLVYLILKNIYLLLYN